MANSNIKLTNFKAKFNCATHNRLVHRKKQKSSQSFPLTCGAACARAFLRNIRMIWAAWSTDTLIFTWHPSRSRNKQYFTPVYGHTFRASVRVAERESKWFPRARSDWDHTPPAFSPQEKRFAHSVFVIDNRVYHQGWLLVGYKRAGTVCDQVTDLTSLWKHICSTILITT